MALFGKQQQRERLVHEASFALLESDVLAEALYHCFNCLQGELPLDAIFIGDIDRSRGVERILAQATRDGGRSLDLSLPIGEPARDDAGQRNEAPDGHDDALLLINRPESSPAAADTAEFLQTTDFSLIILPLLYKRVAGRDDHPTGQRMGTTHFLARRRDAFLPRHAELIELLQRPLTLAVTRARQKEREADAGAAMRLERDWLRARVYAADQPIIGANGGLSRVMELVRHVAAIRNPVLLSGPAGAGKTRLAYAIYREADRSARSPLVPLDVATIPRADLRRRLWGDEGRPGAWRQARDGVLLIESIDQLPLELQRRLRDRLGEDRSQQPRLIATTRRELEPLIATQAFDEQLAAILRAFRIVVPPLAQRRGDIDALVDHFLIQRAPALGVSDPPASSEATRRELVARQWPANLHELQHVVDESLIGQLGPPRGGECSRPTPTSTGAGPSGPDAPPHEALELEALPSSGPADSADRPDLFASVVDERGVLALDTVMADHIRKVLVLAKGRVEGKGGAAELLQINPSTLRKRMRKLGVAYGRRTLDR